MKVIHITLLLNIMVLLVISSVAYRDERYPNSKFTGYFVADFKLFCFQGSPASPAATAAATPSATVQQWTVPVLQDWTLAGLSIIWKDSPVTTVRLSITLQLVWPRCAPPGQTAACRQAAECGRGGGSAVLAVCSLIVMRGFLGEWRMWTCSEITEVKGLWVLECSVMWYVQWCLKHLKIYENLNLICGYTRIYIECDIILRKD